MASNISLVECPRDAMQGWAHFIPTEHKINYLNTLLQVGFDVLDFGSFVSPKAIPQMADTKEVLAGLQMNGSKTKLLAIIANLRGAEEAVVYDEISYLGFPFSISETFQLRNTNKTIKESLEQVTAIQQLCVQKGKELVVYISMGFGNPYGDEYSAGIAINWVKQLAALGIKTVSLADTVGIARPETIDYIFRYLIPEFPEVVFGGHFHSTPDNWQTKIEAAYHTGCLRFDTALKGYGGCPMAGDNLTGNIATEQMVNWCSENGLTLPVDKQKLSEALAMASAIFI